MTDYTADRIAQIKTRWAEIKELYGSWYFNETDYTVCYHLDGHGEIDIAETHSNVSGELIAGATDDIYALIEETERLQELHESASANFYHATKKHAEFLNKLWEIMGFSYEWEYPAQAERHIDERLKELMTQRSVMTFFNKSDEPKDD